MKKLLFFFVVLFALLVCPLPTRAQETTSIDEEGSFEIVPAQDVLDDSFKTVDVIFTDLSESGYKVCLRNDFCAESPWMREMSQENPGKFQSYLNLGFDDDDIDEDAFEDLPDDNKITVCGDGTSVLKKDCPEGKVWFHPGNYYILTVFKKNGNKWMAKAKAGFYINHHSPKVEVTPLNNTSPENFKIKLTQDALTKDGKEKSNNFQVVLEGSGIKEEYCLPNDDLKFRGINESYEFTLPTDNWKKNKDNYVEDKPSLGVYAGKYTIKISERINDNNTKLRSDNCQGGFTYVHFVCTVDGKKPTTCEGPIEDPNESDAKKFFAFLNSLNGGKDGVPLPCNDKKPIINNPLDCDTIDTAIGPIQLTPVGFITRIFSIVLSIAGIGALMLIIYSGYRLMISRGNPEIIKGARETLTSAIIGLIFIVFAFVILSVIAGDILKIPGFG